MSVRKHPTKGPGWWVIDLGYGESRARQPYQGTYADALAAEREARKYLRPGTVNSNPRLQDVADGYLTWYAIHHQPQGTERQGRSMAHVKRFFGRFLLTHIAGPLIDGYKADRLTAGVKRTTINKELAALSGLLKWAADQDMIEDAPKVKQFKAAQVRAPCPSSPPGE